MLNRGIYDRKFNVIDLKAEKLSHVLYAFANVNKDGSIVLGVSEKGYVFKIFIIKISFSVLNRTLGLIQILNSQKVCYPTLITKFVY
jgi:GH18 family chitinase